MRHPKELSPQPPASPQPSPREQRLEQSITSQPRAYLLRRRPARLLESFEDKQGLGRAGIEGSGCHTGGCYSQADVTVGRVAGPPASFGDHLWVPRWRSLGAGMGAQTRAPSSRQRGTPSRALPSPSETPEVLPEPLLQKKTPQSPGAPRGIQLPTGTVPAPIESPRGAGARGRLGQRGHFVPCSPLKLSCHI